MGISDPLRSVAICVAVVLLATTTVLVEGLPILGPDLNSCTPVFPRYGRVAEHSMDCCFVDTSKPIKDFKFNLDLPIRVRRAVHKLDDEYIRKYERAVELMKALPRNDPRSYYSQALLHCTYCSSAYNRFNSSTPISVHKNWYVFPFHRWYLYFHERILASLIGDDTFAVPYWAWDVQNENNPPANAIPSIFVNKNSSLYDEKRSKFHQPPFRVDFQLPAVEHNREADVVMRDNYYTMWRTLIGQVQTPEPFYGGKMALEDGYLQVGGVFETGPHVAVHAWTGDSDDPNGEDMHASYSSARDPTFFAHHSQIDRLWEMWKSWGGEDIDDPDWLDSEFLLYDENADLVRVNVRDSLNFDNFRITYEDLEIDWANFTPKSIRDTYPRFARSRASIFGRMWRDVVSGDIYSNIATAIRSLIGQPINTAVKVVLGGKRRAAVTSRVPRIEMLKSREDSSAYDEVLVMTGVVEMPYYLSVVINAFLELPEADENTPQHCVEFLGGIFVDAEGPDGENHIVARKFTKTVGIGNALQILGVTRQKSVDVTFVPAWDAKHDSHVLVSITSLKVEMKRVKRASIGGPNDFKIRKHPYV